MKGKQQGVGAFAVLIIALAVGPAAAADRVESALPSDTVVREEVVREEASTFASAEERGAALVDEWMAISTAVTVLEERQTELVSMLLKNGKKAPQKEAVPCKGTGGVVIASATPNCGGGSEVKEPRVREPREPPAKPDRGQWIALDREMHRQAMEGFAKIPGTEHNQQVERERHAACVSGAGKCAGEP